MQTSRCGGEALTSAPTNWAERVLGCQAMPPQEIDAVVAADDPATVHRYLELHRERLEEHLADRLRELDAVEAHLAARAATH